MAKAKAKTVKLDTALLEELRNHVAKKEAIRDKIFELSNSERIIKQQIEQAWLQFYQEAEQFSPVFDELEKKHGKDSSIDLEKGVITPTNVF